MSKGIFVATMEAIGSVALLGLACISAVKHGGVNRVRVERDSDDNPLVETISIFKEHGVRADFDRSKRSYADDILSVVKDCEDDGVRCAAIRSLNEIAQSACFSSTKEYILSLIKDI